jgi:hypothetical protein
VHAVQFGHSKLKMLKLYLAQMSYEFDQLPSISSTCHFSRISSVNIFFFEPFLELIRSIRRL